MNSLQAVRTQNGCLAYGITPKAPATAEKPGRASVLAQVSQGGISVVAPKKEGAAGLKALPSGEVENPELVPFYVYLREKAMRMSPEEKRELWASIEKMAEQRGVNLQQFVLSIQIGDCEYHEMLERIKTSGTERA